MCWIQRKRSKYKQPQRRIITKVKGTKVAEHAAFTIPLSTVNFEFGSHVDTLNRDTVNCIVLLHLICTATSWILIIVFAAHYNSQDVLPSHPEWLWQNYEDDRSKDKVTCLVMWDILVIFFYHDREVLFPSSKMLLQMSGLVYSFGLSTWQ